MAQSKGFESDNKDKLDPAAGAGGVGGSDVKQGLHGNSTRTAARGREQEHHLRGDQAELDRGERSESRTGRHYGRSGTEEPGPGYGRGALQPSEGTVARAENDGVDFDELREPEMAGPEAPGHGAGEFAQGRDAGARKQMMPSDGARAKK